MFQTWMKQFFSDPENADGTVIRHRQYFRLGLIIVGGVAFVWALMSMRSQTEPMPSSEPRPEPQKTYAMAANAPDARDVWASKMIAEVGTVLKKMDEVLLENKTMKEQINALESAAKGLVRTFPEASQGQANLSLIPEGEASPSLLSGAPTDTSRTSGSDLRGYVSGSSKASYGELKPVPKMSYVSVETEDTNQFHADNYVVAGSHAQAWIETGLVVSTAVATQSNPLPIVIRLIDCGNLPRGWKSRLKDAKLIGGCYGDLSAERAMCRINTLSFVEEDGTGVEIPVEGWIFGEDSAAGLRGTVVDRAGEVARESLIAGILGGMSNFLKHEATSSVFPVTPFGQTNALSDKEVLKGSLGSGASNALDKLAEFSIKRAEAMQPVIVVDGGRYVDVVFKKGFSLKRALTPMMKVKVSHEES